MTGKKSPGSAQASARQPSDAHVSLPKPSDTETHSQHKEAFAALLSLAAKPIKKID